MHPARQPLFPTLSKMAVQGGLAPKVHDTDAIKSVLTHLGVNQRGWRMLLNFGELLLAPLRGGLIHERRPLAAIENLASFMRLVQQCEMDVPPPPEFCRAWACIRYPTLAHDLSEVPVGLFRAAWIEAVRRQYRGSAFQELLDDEVPAVIEWYFRAEQGRVLDWNQLRSPWAWFRQREQAWRERCSQGLYLDEWPAVLQVPIERKGLRVIELLAAQAVRDEARIMRHCIDSYIEACESGDYGVFSIQDAGTGERIATVGIFIDEERWVIEDVRGPDNEEADEVLWEIAEDVVRCCNGIPVLEHSLPMQLCLFDEAGPSERDRR
jgi:hypothetical protein